VVEVLVKAGAKVNLQDRKGNTPLITACEGGHMSVVEVLLKAGADVNLQEEWGLTPLITAYTGGHVSVVEVLVKAGAKVNLQDRKGNTPLKYAATSGSLSTVKCLVEHGAEWVTQVVDINVSVIYSALILNTPDIAKYLVQTQNKISPGQLTGNVHLFNCLVDIRRAGVTTDSRDDVVVTDRSVWCMDYEGDVWWTIRRGDCGVLRHLLCVGLDVNQSIQLYDSGSKSDVRPLLYTLTDERQVIDRTERVRMLLEAGADVNVRVRYREYDCVLDREGVSVLELTRRRVCENSDSKDMCGRDRVTKYKRVMSEIKKHVRRCSV
jgi:ankyrin repeat protein